MKWGDKHAGYGEHYWDYNHADKGWGGYDGGGGGGKSKLNILALEFVRK